MPFPDPGSVKLGSIREAIRGESLDGWLFCNFRHRDKLSDEILKLPGNSTNSRLWIYAVRADGAPLKIIHAVEKDALASLSGDEIFYVSREELKAALRALSGKTWGCHISENITAVSFLDAGTASLFKKAGLKLVSAEGLVQRFQGLLDAEGISSHERAALHLYEIVNLSWGLVKKHWREKSPLREGDLRSFMLDQMEKRFLFPDHPPIVAAGANAGNPHYDFEGGGDEIKAGDIIQFDLWAKEKNANSIYADISWAGYFGEAIPKEAEKNFTDLVSAREEAFAFIEEELAAGRRPEGASVDEKARLVLIEKGYQKNIKHRTGHGIDTELHGSGVNIDSMEFPDYRKLLDGSCFSLEPGIYFEDRGFRTEIDVYIQNGKAFISGQPRERQFSLLHC